MKGWKKYKRKIIRESKDNLYEITNVGSITDKWFDLPERHTHFQLSLITEPQYT